MGIGTIVGLLVLVVALSVVVVLGLKVIRRNNVSGEEYGFSPQAPAVIGGSWGKIIRNGGVVSAFFGFAILVSSVVYSVNLVANTSKSQDLRSRASSDDGVRIIDGYYATEKRVAQWQEILSRVPLNPNKVEVTAKVGSGKSASSVNLISGKTYPYETISLSWSGAKAVEGGTNITGYYVYFGPKNTEIPFPNLGYDTSVNPVTDGVFVTENTYTASNLKPGRYYLYVETSVDSKTPYCNLGMEQVGYMQTLPAKKLFEYIKE